MSHPAAPQSRLVLVAATAHGGVLGHHGTMPWHFPADLAHFKRVTMGHPMIMGRTTFDTMGALPGRTSIVLTRDPQWTSPGVHIAHDLATAVIAAAQAPGGEAIMVVGGGTVYEQFLPYADALLLTLIDLDVAGDTYFPRIDDDQWSVRELDSQPSLRFLQYDRVPPPAVES